MLRNADKSLITPSKRQYSGRRVYIFATNEINQF
jgi:hypothetical protein